MKKEHEEKNNQNNKDNTIPAGIVGRKFKNPLLMAMEEHNTMVIEKFKAKVRNGEIKE